jgi:hypothetical protein
MHSALFLLRPLSLGAGLSLRFRPKNTSQHIFLFSKLEIEFQDPAEATAKASPGFSVSEKLAPIEFYCADLAEQRPENLLPCPFTGHLTSVVSPSEQLIFKRVR